MAPSFNNLIGNRLPMLSEIKTKNQACRLTSNYYNYVLDIRELTRNEIGEIFYTSPEDQNLSNKYFCKAKKTLVYKLQCCRMVIVVEDVASKRDHQETLNFIGLITTTFKNPLSDPSQFIAYFSYLSVAVIHILMTAAKSICRIEGT